MRNTNTSRSVVKRFSIAFLLFFWSCVAAFNPSAFANQNSLAEQIIKKQRSIKTLSTDFTQEKHSTMLKDPLISEGSFHFMAPDKIAWFYTGQIQIVSNGRDLTLYYPQLKEAEIVSAQNSLIRLPLNFNLSELRQYFDDYVEEKEGKYVVTLTPLDEASLFSRMVITLLNVGAPEKVEIFEKGGDRSTIRFFNQKVNKGIAEKIFTLQLPEDTIIRRLQQE